MTYHTDPAAAFTARLGDANRIAAAPVQPARHVPGLLPDPRNPNGPRWAIAEPEYPRHHLQRAESANGVHWFFATGYKDALPTPEDGRRFWPIVPADPERYERARGWLRPHIVAAVVAMGLAVLVVAYAALLPW